MHLRSKYKARQQIIVCVDHSKYTRKTLVLSECGC